MKSWRTLIVFLALSLGTVYAEQQSFGIGGVLFGGTSIHLAPFLTVQYSLPLEASLRARAQFDIYLAGVMAAGDVIYTVPIGESWKAYAGIGLDALWLVGLQSPLLGLHGVFGGEIFTGAQGYFAEVQPILPITSQDLGTFLFKARAGLNFYF